MLEKGAAMCSPDADLGPDTAEVTRSASCAWEGERPSRCWAGPGPRVRSPGLQGTRNRAHRLRESAALRAKAGLDCHCAIAAAEGGRQAILVHGLAPQRRGAGRQPLDGKARGRLPRPWLLARWLGELRVGPRRTAPSGSGSFACADRRRPEPESAPIVRVGGPNGPVCRADSGSRRGPAARTSSAGRSGRWPRLGTGRSSPPAPSGPPPATGSARSPPPSVFSSAALRQPVQLARRLPSAPRPIRLPGSGSRASAGGKALDACSRMPAESGGGSRGEIRGDLCWPLGRRIRPLVGGPLALTGSAG